MQLVFRGLDSCNCCVGGQYLERVFRGLDSGNCCLYDLINSHPPVEKSAYGPVVVSVLDSFNCCVGYLNKCN